MLKKINLFFAVAVVFTVMFCLGFQPASAQGQKLPECIKINAKITLENLKNPTSNALEDMTFKPGVVVSQRALVAGECRFTADAINVGCAKDKLDLHNPPAVDVKCHMEGNKSEFGALAMLNTLYAVTNWVFFILTIVAVLMIVFGGFTYITAAGDPTKAGKGKSILMYAIIGLAIALLAKMIPTLVRFIMGV